MFAIKPFPSNTFVNSPVRVPEHVAPNRRRLPGGLDHVTSQMDNQGEKGRGWVRGIRGHQHRSDGRKDQGPQIRSNTMVPNSLSHQHQFPVYFSLSFFASPLVVSMTVSVWSHTSPLLPSELFSLSVMIFFFF